MISIKQILWITHECNMHTICFSNEIEISESVSQYYAHIFIVYSFRKIITEMVREIERQLA